MCPTMNDILDIAHHPPPPQKKSSWFCYLLKAKDESMETYFMEPLTEFVWKLESGFVKCC
jgi:hypothetical protein